MIHPLPSNALVTSAIDGVLPASLNDSRLRLISAAAVTDLLQLKPDFSISFARDHLFYLKRPDQIETYLTETLATVEGAAPHP